MKLKIIWAPALLLFYFSPAYGVEETVPVSTAPAVRQEIIVSTLTFAQALEKFDDGALFVDNRPSHKFKAGHIPGALNMPYFEPGDEENAMDRDALIEAAGDREIVFYCTGYFRAYHAARQALAWGLRAGKVYWYKGGFNEWSRSYVGEEGGEKKSVKAAGQKKRRGEPEGI